ncbi:toll-like receptor 5b isoform X3 [Perca flavescens]|uniref:toll-like receptor 5b isoform X3 n=1 Tax=Perca flavescens TaxID=8167 RepID=UPI00106DE996|nr:toll-like receptor 5 isoform X3 [Perca flavescens]
MWTLALQVAFIGLYLQPDLLPASLQRLDLSNNFLASPDPMAFRSLSVLSLADNRFYCDCNLESLLTWLNVTDVIFLSPVEEYRCEFPAALQNTRLLDYFTIIEPCEEDDEKAVQDLKFALFIFSALLVITAILSGIAYARLRGRIFIIYKKIVGRVVEGPKPPPPVDEAQYDAFFCFSSNDHGWVEAALLKKLDKEFSEENIFRCCFEARDFLPGGDHLSNIRDAIWGSRKTVCVVSKEFLKVLFWLGDWSTNLAYMFLLGGNRRTWAKPTQTRGEHVNFYTESQTTDGWCLEAFTLAQGQMLEELTNVLIMLVVGKVARYQLMKYNAVRTFVRSREYLIWPEDPQDLEWFYDRLVSQILKDTKVKAFAEDKPEPAQPDVQTQNEDSIQLENIGAVAM